MRRILNYVLCVLAVLFLNNVTAQQVKYVKGIAELKVGDMMPDTKIQKIINGVKSSAQTAEFKDQLLILDFWDTTCGSCIEALPHMEQLQKTFGSKIKILPVTPQNEQLIRGFWKKNSYTKNLSLPSVVEDTILHTYFRHHGVPHEIWVYKGKVIGITDGEHVDEQNIKAVLEGGKPSLPLKYDFYPAYDDSKPLFNTNSTQIDEKNTAIRYAVISDYKPGINWGSWNGPSSLIRDSVHKTVRVSFLNTPIHLAYDLYLRNIYKTKGMVTPIIIGKPNNTVWEVVDRSKYRYRQNNGQGYSTDWVEDHAICFEAVYSEKGQSDEQVYKSAIKDMNRLLGLNVRWEKRKEKVYVIRDKAENPANKKNLPAGKSDLSLYGLEDYWNQHENYPYLFDESVKANKGIGMDIDTADMLSNVPKLKLKLADYGLELSEEEGLVDKIVFTEIDGGLLLDGKAQAAAKAEKEAQKDMPGPTPEEGKAFLEANKTKPDVVVLPSGLQYKILKEGNGVIPDSTSKVTARYKGTFVNGKVFDSSDLQGKPITFIVKDMIAGWIEALRLMPSGSKWVLYVPSELAYGESSNSGRLPKSSVLVFELELLRVEKGEVTK